VATGLAACGAEVRSDSRPGGAAHAVPMKDGVPLGDCIDVDAATQRSQGCPDASPELESPCEEPGKACTYIRIEAGASNQVTYTCQGDDPNWGDGAWALCADSCGMTQTNTFDFDASTCTRRTLAVCDDGTASTMVAPPNASLLTIAMLTAAFEACDAIG